MHQARARVPEYGHGCHLSAQQHQEIPIHLEMLGRFHVLHGLLVNKVTKLCQSCYSIHSIFVLLFIVFLFFIINAVVDPELRRGGRVIQRIYKGHQEMRGAP